MPPKTFVVSLARRSASVSFEISACTNSATRPRRSISATVRSPSGVTVHDCHLGSFVSKQKGCRFANAVTRARDDCHLVLQSHVKCNADEDAVNSFAI